MKLPADTADNTTAAYHARVRMGIGGARAAAAAVTGTRSCPLVGTSRARRLQT